MKNPRTLELVKSDYQPSKAEREQKISLEFPDGLSDMEKFNMIADAMLKPVKIRWIDKPRSRR